MEVLDGLDACIDAGEGDDAGAGAGASDVEFGACEVEARVGGGGLGTIFTFKVKRPIVDIEEMVVLVFLDFAFETLPCLFLFGRDD